MPKVIVPPEGVDIWTAFWDMRRFLDPETRISPRDMMDYRELYEAPLGQAEIRIICEMDRQFAETRAQEIKYNEERRKGANG